MHLYSEHVILRQRDVVAAAEHWHHDMPQLPHVHEFMEIVVVVAGTAVHRTRSGSSGSASAPRCWSVPGNGTPTTSQRTFRIGTSTYLPKPLSVSWPVFAATPFWPLSHRRAWRRHRLPGRG